MAGKSTPLSPVDAGWFHMDGPTNLAMVAGVIMTNAPLSVTRVKEVFTHRLLPFERFRQRVVERGMPFPVPHWEDDPHFDIDAHIRHIALPAPGDEAALLDLLSDLASTPLDYNRPLWQLHIIDGVPNGGALVLRFHHCVADGTAMMAVAPQVFDATPNAPVTPHVARPSAPPGGLLDRLAAAAQRAMSRSTQFVEESTDLLRNPGRVRQIGQGAVYHVAVAASTLLKESDPPSVFKGKVGTAKRVAWSHPLPLAQVKAVGAASGAKVNDVLVATMTGALRHYMQERQETVDGLTIRAVVPVNLRSPHRALELGNQFGIAFLDLPIGLASAEERLRLTKQAMDSIKSSGEATVFMNIIGLFGMSPKIVEDVGIGIFGTKATLAFTNVVGPRERLFLAGAAVERIIFWVPHPGTLGLGISILSYNDEVTLGIVADAGLVPDPERIAALFGYEFARLWSASHPATDATSAGTLL